MLLHYFIFLVSLAQVFGIGSAARYRSTIGTNKKNN